MRRMLSAGVVALVAVGLVAGCSKKTMKDSTPPPAPEPTRTEAPPPPPPPSPPTPKAPERLELNDVFFDYDASGLRDDARATLTANGKQLVGSQATATIEGHCDERGTTDYNLALGEKRANAAKDFLVSYGVDAGRLKTISYGENRPFAMGHDEAAFSQNRRAHFVVENR